MKACRSLTSRPLGSFPESGATGSNETLEDPGFFQRRKKSRTTYCISLSAQVICKGSRNVSEVLFTVHLVRIYGSPPISKVCLIG